MPELPPPLPPSERTVGQLIAETIRTYGDNFWRALPLGLPLAVLDLLALDRSAVTRIVLFVAFAPLLAFAFARASALVGRVEPGWRAAALATAIGAAVLLPAAVLLMWFALLAVAYLAFVGLVVPVAVIEGKGPVASLRRAIELGRADYVHAVGSLATLVIVFFLSRLVLVLLLQDQADNTIRVAVLIADVILAPVLLLGAAVLYLDQAARVGVRRPGRGRRRGSGRDSSGPADARTHR
jgi:hypothetical protein